MANFEYKLINLDHVPNLNDEKLLNQLGEEGWEVVSMTPSEQKVDGWVDGGVVTTGEIKGGITTISILLKRECHTQASSGYQTAKINEYANIPNGLFDFSNFVQISKLCKSRNLDSAGLYCIRLASGKHLPERYAPYLKEHRIIYIGQASTSLYERFWKQELNAEGHGTFFRSLGAMLGYLPPQGSLAGKETRNYKFSRDDEQLIKRWMEDNLVVNCISLQKEQLDAEEQKYITTYRPLLNIAHNPDALQILSDDREKCVRYARMCKRSENTTFSSAGHCKVEIKGLREALEENLKLQNIELQKGNDLYFCVTDILSEDVDFALPQIISDDNLKFRSKDNGPVLCIYVPFSEECEAEINKFKKCKISRHFKQGPEDFSFYLSVGKDIDAAINVIWELFNDYYHIPDNITLKFETWIDN